jgi:putative tryptophan/tyrosine transport system substrate-binding protein
MRRRAFIGSSTGLLLLAATARAQTALRSRRVGVLMDGPLPAFEGLREGLRLLGYREGENLALSFRWAAGAPARYGSLAQELVGDNVEVIVTYGTLATIGAGQATSTVPIVAAGVGDAATNLFFASLARPGGNITGFITLENTLWGKRLALMREMLPSLKRVAYFTASNNPNTPSSLRSLGEAAAEFGISAREAALPDGSLPAALSKALPDGEFDGVLVSTEPFLRTHRAIIAGFMAERRLPAFHGSRDFVEAGGLMSYGTDYHDLFRRAAEYVHRVMKGEAAGELPVQRADRFELLINLKAAQALAIAIPPLLLARADELIE